MTPSKVEGIQKTESKFKDSLISHKFLTRLNKVLKSLIRLTRSVVKLSQITIICLGIFLFIPTSTSSQALPLDITLASPENTNFIAQDRYFITESQITLEIQNAVSQAYKKSREYALHELNDWVDNTPKSKVEPNFLNWYFKYCKKIKAKVSAPYRWLSGQDAAATIAEDFQREFSKRVLNKETLQRKTEEIATKAVDVFLQDFSFHFSRIAQEYGIPQQKWTEYLDRVTNDFPNVPRESREKDFGGVLAEAIDSSVQLAAQLTLEATDRIAILLVKESSDDTFAPPIKQALDIASSSFVPKTGVDFSIDRLLVGLVFWSKSIDATNSERLMLKSIIFDYLDEVTQVLVNNKSSGIVSVIDARREQLYSYLTEIEDLKEFTSQKGPQTKK
ncbi:MAG: hypothetical protein F6K00_31520 [Leptolyngbya sp. SIOISBB]|nr:hypothetical protein [Leptolyngbya sp. SIOISBB]